MPWKGVSSMTEKCKHCGNTHETRCPWIKSIEYFEDGTIKRVEYITPADYSMPYTPYLVPQPPPIYPQPVPFIPIYPQPVIPIPNVWTISFGSPAKPINTTGGSHSTLYNS